MEPEFEFKRVGEKVVAELTAGTVITEQDVTDLVGNASFSGADRVLVNAERLSPEFFDLSSGLAGTVFQKFSNYRLGLIVVGFDRSSASESLSALITESNRGNVVWFVDSAEEALARVAAAR